MAKHSTDGLWNKALQYEDEELLCTLFEYLLTRPDQFAFIDSTKEARRNQIKSVETSINSLVHAINASSVPSFNGLMYAESLTVGSLLEHCDPDSETGHRVPPDSCVLKFPPKEQRQENLEPAFDLVCDVKLIQLLEYAKKRVQCDKTFALGSGYVRKTDDVYLDARSAFTDLIVCAFYCAPSSGTVDFPQKEIVDTVDAILSARMPERVPENLSCYETVFKGSERRVKKMNAQFVK